MKGEKKNDNHSTEIKKENPEKYARGQPQLFPA